MAFHNVTFPTMLKVGSKGGREWAVDVYENSLSGAEQRNLYHSNGRRRYTAEKGNVNETQKDELVAFWDARQGKTHSFYYNDDGVLVPVRFNMDRFEPEQGGPEHWVIQGIELIEVIGEV